jgi:raffinose/stachyose/melibiose transport system permease protein
MFQLKLNAKHQSRDLANCSRHCREQFYLENGRQVTTLSSRQNTNSLIPYLYIAPLLIFSGILLYYCIGFTIFTSFHEWNGIDTTMKFIGLQNFSDLLSDRVLYIALLNNLLFLVFTVGIQAGLGLFIAVLLRSKPVLTNLFKSIFFMPVIMAPVIIAAIFRIIMDFNLGSLNSVLRFFKLDFLAVAWLGDPRFSLTAIIMVNIFEWLGFSMIIYYAGLLSIPNEIYESAKIDGSGFWNTLLKISLPMLKGTTATLVVLGIVGSLKTFDIVYMLTGGGPGRSTEFLTTFLYKKSIDEFNGGAAATIGVVILVVALVMSVIQIKYYEKTQKDME